MRRPLPQLLVLALAATATALTGAGRTLNPQEALQRALDGADAPAALQQRLPALRSQAPRLVQTLAMPADLATPAVYVYDAPLGEKEGFLVVSADDASPAVLGFSDAGPYDAADAPPAMAWWLRQYARQVEWAAAHPAADNWRWRLPEQDGRRSIAPLCKTRWNQEAPFWNDCPVVNNAHTYTGCVATSTSQAMKYFNHPARPTGTVSYTSEVNIGNSQTKDLEITEDLSRYTLDWADMLDDYSGDYTAAQGEAVARLMYLVGVSEEMAYGIEGTSGSGAYDTNIPGALINHFGYDQGTHLEMRDYYDRPTWEQMIYDNISTLGPVIYGGSGSGGGHSFICDGYSSGRYFHINWGWGGVSDGYFLLSALDPSTQGAGGSSDGAGFSWSQSAILGIQLPVEGSQPASFQAGTTIVSGAEVYDGKLTFQVNPYTYEGAIWNISSVTGVNVKLGAIVASTDTPDQAVATLVGNTLASFKPGTGSSPQPLDLAAAGLPDGTYRVYPAWQEGQGQWQRMLTAVGTPRYVLVSASGGQFTATVPAAATLTATDVTPESPFYSTCPFRVSMHVANDNAEEVLTEIRATFGQEAYGTVMIYGVGNMVPVDLAPGASTDLVYESTLIPYANSNPVRAGKYYLRFADSNDNWISDPQEVTVNATPTSSSCSVSAFSFDGDARAADPERLEFTATLSCTAGYFARQLDVYLFDVTAGQTSSDSFIPGPQVFLAEGDPAQTVTISGAFPEAKAGHTYRAVLCAPTLTGTSVSQLTALTADFTVGQATGIDGVPTCQPGEDAPVEWYTVQGVRLGHAPAAPGLYIRRQGTASQKVVRR